MEQVGFIFGLVAFVWCLTLNEQISKMKRMLRDAGIGESEKESMQHILAKSRDSVGIIEFNTGEEETELQSKKCKILDIDTEWVLVETEKKSVKKLIRIHSIKSLQFTKLQ